MQAQTQVFRPTIDLRVLAETIKAMPPEDAEKVLQPDNELGMEMRRAMISGFVRTRRLARENAKMRKENSEQKREMRRNIAQLEGGGPAFMDIDNLLKCRRMLRKIDDMGNRLRESAADLGLAIDGEVSYLTVALGRDAMLDLLNVGSFAKEWANDREHPVSIAEILRAGFADESARGKSNRDIEPMQFCLLRAGRGPFVPPKVEATPGRFGEKMAELDTLRDEITPLMVTMHESKKIMGRKARGREKARCVLETYVSSLERAFVLWERAQPALMDCKEFSMEQKAALLKANPAKVEKADLPADTSLLEMLVLQAEACGDHDFGPLLWLGLVANSDDPREHVEFYRGATSQEAMMEQASKRGASVFNAVGTLQ